MTIFVVTSYCRKNISSNISPRNDLIFLFILYFCCKNKNFIPYFKTIYEKKFKSSISTNTTSWPELNDFLLFGAGERQIYVFFTILNNSWFISVAHFCIPFVSSVPRPCEFLPSSCNIFAFYFLYKRKI